MRTAMVLGKGSLAVKVADWLRRSDEWELAWVVPVIPEPTWTDSLSAWAEEHELPVVASGFYGDLPGVQDDGWTVDLAVSVTYDRIIKDWFIQKCGRILNIHNGPLPRYRGVSPINWALKNGEHTHGVTIHEITPGIDDGPIVAQTVFTIYPETDEVVEVYQRCLAFGWTLFEQTMPILDSIEAVPQDEAAATYHSRAQDAELGERRGFRRELSASG